MSTVQIKSLFTRSIHRSINGVIKADQDDAESVWQELEGLSLLLCHKALPDVFIHG